MRNSHLNLTTGTFHGGNVLAISAVANSDQGILAIGPQDVVLHRLIGHDQNTITVFDHPEPRIRDHVRDSSLQLPAIVQVADDAIEGLPGFLIGSLRQCGKIHEALVDLTPLAIVHGLLIEEPFPPVTKELLQDLIGVDEILADVLLELEPLLVLKSSRSSDRELGTLVEDLAQVNDELQISEFLISIEEMELIDPYGFHGFVPHFPEVAGESGVPDCVQHVPKQGIPRFLRDFRMSTFDDGKQRILDRLLCLLHHGSNFNLGLLLLDQRRIDPREFSGSSPSTVTPSSTISRFSLSLITYPAG